MDDISTKETGKQADGLPGWFGAVVREFGLMMIEPKQVNGRKLSGYCVGTETSVLAYRSLDRLLAMTADEVREWCGRLVSPPEFVPDADYIAAELEARKPARKPFSGRYMRKDR